MTFKVIRNFNKEENRWEYICTDGHKYCASFYKDYGTDREETLIHWFNGCLRTIRENDKAPPS